jgi:uncharacterized protein YndB with AHSA1/START domain
MTTTSDKRTTLTLPTDEQILIERSFDAPRHLVWRAYTEPELVRQWWHAGRGTMTACDIDLRVGGAWRFAMTAKEGYEVAFHGEYREIAPDERLVSTEVYEGAPDSGEALNTLTLVEADGRTKLSIVMELPDRQTRDMVIASGMEDGLGDALELLERAAQALS